jgi:hypothetical protein
VAKNDSEALFFEMLRSLVLTIGWLFSAIFTLLGILFDEINDFFRNSQERKREAKDSRKTIEGPHGDTTALKQSADEFLKAANFPSPDDFLSPFTDRVESEYKSQLQTLPILPLFTAIVNTAYNLYEYEQLYDLSPMSVISGAIEQARYRDFLIAQKKKLVDPAKTANLFTSTIINASIQLAQKLPPSAFNVKMRLPEQEDFADAGITVSDALANVPQAVEDLAIAFNHPEVVELGLFPKLRNLLKANVEAVNALPTDYKGGDVVHTFLKHTPLERLFRVEIPFTISIANRLEHTAIIAGSGWGKTQLLQRIIVRDLEQPDPPSIVVIDSTNRMIERLQRISLFNDRLKDRVVLIDPERFPVPALNMFDINTPRMQGYTSDMRERVESDVIGLFSYVFSSIQNPLTDPMRTAFSYIVRLLITIPDANITMLRNLLEENPKGGYEASSFKPYIEKLDPTARDFFKVQFFTERVAATRSSILQRLSSVISVPAFERMFSTVNKVDFFDEMQRGSCILVNTSEALLKDASVLFGRYIIARVMAAAFERASLPDEKRKPTFLIVDEAAPYFDDQFEKLLTRVRQFKLGTVIAFQHLEQAPEKLRSAIASCTTVKYAGGLGYADRRWLAREMETTPEFIGSLKKDAKEPPQWTHYACHVRGMDKPVNLTVPFYTLENMSKMTDAQHAQFLERNRQRVSAPSTNPPPPGPSPTEPPSLPPDPGTVKPLSQPTPRRNNPDAGPGSDGSPSW